jgi:hypothetical protein
LADLGIGCDSISEISIDSLGNIWVTGSNSYLIDSCGFYKIKFDDIVVKDTCAIHDTINTAITQITNVKIAKTYPNPFNNGFYIDLDEESLITITNINGCISSA